MATVLENYYALRGELEQRMAQAPINAVDLWYYGEIVYRVGVLETCQMYLRSAPVSMNTPELLGHYQMMDAYVQSLALERRYPASGEAAIFHMLILCGWSVPGMPALQF